MAHCDAVRHSQVYNELIKPGHLVKIYKFDSDLRKNKLLYRPYLLNYMCLLFVDVDYNSYCAKSQCTKLIYQDISKADLKLFFADYPMLHKRVTFRNVFVKWLGRKWGAVFNAYSKNLHGYILHLFKIIAYYSYLYSMCEEGFINYLKKIGQNALTLAASGKPDFLFLINLEVLGGYDTVNNRKNVLKEQYLKVSSIPSNTYKIDDRFKYYLNKNLQNIVIKQKDKHQSFSEYIGYRDNWSLGTSCTDGVPLSVLDNRTGRRITRMKGKMFKLTSFSNDEIQNNCYKKKKCLISTFIKRDEPAKCRNIQNFDIYSFLRCSYFESFIQQYNNDLNAFSYWTSCGLTPDKLSHLFEQYGELLKTGNITAVSIDQSEFDMHQPIAAIKYILSALINHIKKYSDKKYHHNLQRLLFAELFALSNMFVINEEKQIKYRWIHGLPSGYKFTALVGSLLNATLNNIILEDLRLPVCSQIYQGDDALIFLHGMYSDNLLQNLSLRYKNYGLLLNVSKCIISTTSFEYLKHFYLDRYVYGIPVRAFKSIVWRKPKVMQVFETVNVKFQNVLSNLRMCSRRRCVYITRNIIYIMYQFLFKLDPYVDRDKVKECVYTPSIYGGMGYGMHGTLALVFTKEYDKYFYDNFDIEQSTIHPKLRNKFFLDMLKRRIIDYIPFKGVKTRYTFISLNVKKYLKNYDWSKYIALNTTNRPLEINWPSDKYKGSQYYYKKLKLEYFIHNKLPIPRHLLTDHRLIAIKSPKRVLKIILMYNKYANSSLSVENSRYNILNYARNLQDINNMWLSTLVQVLVSCNSRCDMFMLIKYFQSVVYNMMQTTTTYSSLHYLF